MFYKHHNGSNGMPTILLRSQITDDIEFLNACEGKMFKVVRVDDRSLAFEAVVPEKGENEIGVPAIVKSASYDAMNTADLATLAVQRGLNPYISDDGKNKQLASKGNIIKLIRLHDQAKALQKE
jgi:hypothetical protein